MTSTSSQQENLSTEARERVMEPAASVHIEQTPCVVIRAVDAASEAPRGWRPRTLHAWLI